MFSALALLFSLLAGGHLSPLGLGYHPADVTGGPGKTTTTTAPLDVTGGPGKNSPADVTGGPGKNSPLDVTGGPG